MPDRRVTVTEIARLSDASPTTVSLVLRDKPGISPETRDRVLAAARELGYRPRAPRQATTHGAVRNVAMLMRARTRAQSVKEPRVNPFYSWVLTGMEAQARQARLNLLYAHLPVDNRNEILDFPDHLMEQPLDGAIVVGPFSDASIDALLGAGPPPVVLVDAPAMPRRFDVIASDNEAGAYTAVRHLIANGHRHIALVAPDVRPDPNFWQRAAGYARALAEDGLAECHATFEHDDVAQAVNRLLAEHPEVTAIFSVNDFFGVLAIAALQATGRRVPEDISVMGFDDTEHVSYMGPPLTTMAVDKLGMGRLAVQMLEYRMAWPEAAVSCTSLMPRLVERASVSRARGE